MFDSKFVRRFDKGQYQDASPAFARRVLKVARKRRVRLTPERLGRMASRISIWRRNRQISRKDVATFSRIVLDEAWRRPEDAGMLVRVYRLVLDAVND